MSRWMIRLEGGGPLDGLPLIANGLPEELHLPYTDEMVRLSDQKMTAESVDVTSRPHGRRLAGARAVAIYACAEGQSAEAQPPAGPRIATYVFREELTPSQYLERYGTGGRGA